MKKTLMLLMALFIIIFSGCTVHKAPMTIVTEDYPPLSFAEGDSITGFGTEVIRELQKELNSHDAISLMDWDDAYHKALNEPNVVIYTMEKTSARDSLFNWIGPLGQSKTYFYVKKDSKLDINSLEDAKKVKSIATTTDWFSEQYLKKNGFENLISFGNPKDNVKQLMNDSVQMSIFTDITVQQIIEDAGYNSRDLIPVYEVLTTEYYIAISKKTDPIIVEKWSQAFNSIKSQGILKRLSDRWFR
jgi:polar amino acid transport system substrate-binding protein